MIAYQLNFEKGFVLHYPDALGEDKGLIFVFCKGLVGGNSWLMYSAANGDYLSRADAPPELYVPSGTVGYIWHVDDLEKRLGFALEDKPEQFDGYVEQTEDGWLVQSIYGQLLACLLYLGFPDRWGWVAQQT